MTRALTFCLAILISTAAVGAAQQPSPMTEVHVVVTDESGAPVEGAFVTCVPVTHGRARETLPGPDERVATNAEGLSVFGPYASAMRFVVHTEHENKMAFQNVSIPWRKATPEKVALVLEPPHHYMRGTVTDVTGQPLPEVRVIGWSALPLAETDAQGQFTFGVPRGASLSDTFLLRPDYGVMEWRTWDRYSEFLIIFPRGTVVSGTVLMPDGSPADGVNVKHNLGITQTDTAGRFETMPVAIKNGAFSVEVHEEVDGREMYGWQTFEGFPNAPAELPLKEIPRVARPPVREVRLSQPYYESARGKYVDVVQHPDLSDDPDTILIQGRALHAETGEGVQGSIHLLYTTDEPASESQPMAESDADGVFWVRIHKKYHRYLAFRPYQATLYPESAYLELDFGTLERGQELDIPVQTGCAIHGKLLTDTGEPLQFKWIYVHPAPDEINHVVTRNDGTFSLNHLPNPGTKYTVRTGSNRATTAEVGPLKKGEIATDVVLYTASAKSNPPNTPVQVAKVPGGTLSGRVVDESGSPVNSVVVYMQESGQPISDTTDLDGQFEMTFMNAGQYGVQIYRGMSLAFPGESPRGIRHEHIIVAGPQPLSLKDGESRDDLTYVVKPTRKELLFVRTLNEYMEPIQANVKVIHGGYGREDQAFRERHGLHLIQKLPEGPFLLEATAPGYQARVFELGRDFELSDSNVVMTLKQGSFPEDVSVFAAVTGRPAEQSEVDAMLLGDYVLRNERRYTEWAAAIDQEVIRLRVAAQQKRGWPVRVSRADGKPVNRIYFQRVSSSGEAPFPNPAIRPSTIAGNEGVFRLKDRFGYLWADGTALARFGFPRDVSDELLDVVLPEACTLELQVTDYEGNPVEGLLIVPGSGSIIQGIERYPTTDAEGNVRVAPLPPGLHEFRLLDSPKAGQHTAPTVRAELRPGDLNVVHYRYGEPAPGTPLATLAVLEKKSQNGVVPETVLDGLSEAEKIALAAVVVEEIGRLPANFSWNQKQRPAFLAALAQRLNASGGAKALRDYLQRARIHDTSFYFRVPTFAKTFSAVIGRLTEIEGDGLTSFLSELAEGDKTAPPVRIAALVGLGKIGTQESVAAYVRILDNARQYPHAPAPKESYTHAERMADTLYMTVFVIPYAAYTGLEPPDPPSPKDAWVDETYQTGNLRAGTINSGSTQYTFRRFGDQWLVVEIGYTWIS